MTTEATVETVDPNRPGAGRLNGVDAPLGTMLGPDDSGQMFTVIGRDDRGVTVDLANTHDRTAALARDPQSLTEVDLHRGAGLMP